MLNVDRQKCILKILPSIPLLCFLFFITSCNYNPKYKLPILGQQKLENGKMVDHTIRPFKFINQDSQLVTNETFRNKVYVADFFFISCPSICPLMSKQMRKLYRHYENEPDLLFLSHTIDPKHDTPERLRHYAQKLGVSSGKWHFVTGIKDSIYNIAQDYFIAIQDKSNGTDPASLIHSGKFMLIDGSGRVRGFCDGTDPKSVDKFMFDIDHLLEEQKEINNEK